MPGTVTSTTNCFVPTTASGSINNTDNHAFQATLDLTVNNMASIQTQFNHVIDMQNVPINDDQHAKHGKSSQPDMTAPVPGVYIFVTSTIFNIIWSRLGDRPPRHAHFQFVKCACVLNKYV